MTALSVFERKSLRGLVFKDDWFIDKEDVMEILDDLIYGAIHKINKPSNDKSLLNSFLDEYFDEDIIRKGEGDYFFKRIMDGEEDLLVGRISNISQEENLLRQRKMLYTHLLLDIYHSNIDYMVNVSVIEYEDVSPELLTFIRAAFEKHLKLDIYVSKNYFINSYNLVVENYINDLIDLSLSHDIVKLDKTLQEKRSIDSEHDKLIVNATYKWLNIDHDDYSGRNWVMIGRDKYGRSMVSFETKEIRGLTIGEFYGGAVVD